MESANLQVLRRMEELFNERDLDTYLESMDRDVEWHVADEDPDTTVHRGRDEVRGYLTAWIDAFSDLEIRMEDVRDGGERIGSDLRFRGHGTESGAPLDERIGFIFTFRDGRVTRVEDLGRDQSAVS